MDSEGNFPYDPSDHCYANNGICDTLGGNGISPDYWFYLGACDYGKFIDAGAEWSSRGILEEGIQTKSILLDLSNPKVRNSYGVTQTVSLLQTEQKALRFTGWVASENSIGKPRINVILIGYPEDGNLYPCVGDVLIEWETGTYDFSRKRATIIPNSNKLVKYIFVHMLPEIGSYTSGKSWYTNFYLEEIDIPQSFIDNTKNSILNPEFIYNSNDLPIAWDITNSSILETIVDNTTNTYIKINPSGKIEQKNIVINKGYHTHDIYINATSEYGQSEIIITIKLLGRYRNIINEIIKIITLNDNWNIYHLNVYGTEYSEKIDIAIELNEGNYCLIDNVSLISTEIPDLNSNYIFNNKKQFNIINIDNNNYDYTKSINYSNPIKFNQIQLNPNDYEGDLYVCDGVLSKFSAISNIKSLTICNKEIMTKINDNEYTLSIWNNSIFEIYVNEEINEEYLRIPHLAFVDFWNITNGGNIPANETRYYTITAYNNNGETDRSNEIKAITDSVSNNNKVPIEITPVKNAEGYKVYMTKSVVDPPDWIYQAHNVEKLNWDDGQNHLLLNVTADELKNSGYLLYDTGQLCQEGNPPTIHTAIKWVRDNNNHKIIFENNNIPVLNSIVKCRYVINKSIISIIYIRHSDSYYVACDNGIYKSDIYNNSYVDYIYNDIGIVDLDYYNNNIWYMKNNGIIKDLNGNIFQLVIGNYKYFCWVDDYKIARMINTGYIEIINKNGNIIRNFIIKKAGEVEYIGLGMYFDKLLTYNKIQNKFIIFDLYGNIINEIESPIIGINSWCIQSTNLVIYSDIGITVFRIYANEYYSKLDQQEYIDAYPQNPNFYRPILPDEYIVSEYPELLDNGTFENGDIFPTGFITYLSNISGTNSGFTNDIYIIGTRAVYFTLPQDIYTWFSFNKDKINVIGGRQYVFSAYTKSTINATGGLNVTFKDYEGNEISSLWWNVNYTTSYKLNEIVIQAPINAISINFRYMGWGSGQNAVTYILNSLSVKEELSPTQSFEHIYNGNFELHPIGSTNPSGWEIVGEQPSMVTTYIENSTMQTEGNSFRIDLLPFSEIGWSAIQTQKFNITEGDTLKLSFYYKNSVPGDIYLQCSLYYYLADRTNNETQHLGVNITNTDQGNHITIVFPPNPNNSVTARLTLWPQHNCSNWFENVSLYPYINTNKVSNGDFSDGLNGWSTRGYNLNDILVDNIGSIVTNDIYYSSYASIEMTCDYINCKYAELRRYIAINQIDPIKIGFEAWAKGNNINNGRLQFSVVIECNDGSLIWDAPGEQEIFPIGTFDWTKIYFEFDPAIITELNPITKPIKGIYLNFNLINNGTVDLSYKAWIDDVKCYELPDELPINGLNFTLPYTELSANTIKQITLDAQITNNNIALEQINKNVIWSSVPNIGSFITLPTNVKGISKALYTLPDKPCKVTITATINSYSVSNDINIYPLIDLRDNINILDDLSLTVNELYIEAIAPKVRKPLPDVNKRIGRWEVFRPTYYNYRQILDYDIHYSPQDWATNQNKMVNDYPKQIYFWYKDWLSDYPNETSWGEIINKRKEWFCYKKDGLSNPFGDRRYDYNWKNLELCQWFTDRVLKLHGNNTWSDGLYIDDYGGEVNINSIWQEWETKASDLLNFRTVKERHEAQATILNIIRKQLHKNGKYLTCNQGAPRRFLEDGSFVPDSAMIVNPFDGHLLECWVYTSSFEPRDIISSNSANYEKIQPSNIKDEIDFIKWCGENNQFVAAQARSGPQCWEARMFSLSAFLMGKHAYSYYFHSCWGMAQDQGAWKDPYGDLWHGYLPPETMIYTGNPLEDYQFNNWLFSRKFENCVALLNMNETTQTYVLPDGVWYTIRGQSYSGIINILWRQGLVLVKERP